ncbi:hypothetical protein [Streptomyces sp. NPDC003077]|uniref:hypothetical protein n=1 Tax=Streptomyces sp. NPDC003077 TaxID=3154443 RepID=UPI0033A3E1E6
MRARTLAAALVPSALAVGSVLALAPTASAAPHRPTPHQFVAGGGVVKICTRGTFLDGLVSMGCRAPHALGTATTWRDLREEEDAVTPMLCRPSLVNELFERTEVAATGAGAALQCTPVPSAWYR